jgi:tape measure domain-containing protein
MAFLQAMELGARISVSLGDSLAKIGSFSKALNMVDQAAFRGQMALFGLSGMFTAVAAAATVTTGAVVAFGMAGLQAAADYEQSELAFTTLLGSAEKARTFLDELETFAARTPFEFKDLQQASRRMLAMGFAVEQVMPMMTVVGDAASAMGGDINDTAQRIVYALGQVKAKSRVMTQEMNQLTETGVFGWMDLAHHMGVTVPQAMDMVEKRQVGASTLIEAFAKHSQEKFKNMMEVQSHTTLGMLSTLKDEINRSLRTAFQPANKEVGKIILALTELVRFGRLIGPAFGEGVGEALGMFGDFLLMLTQGTTGTRELGESAKQTARMLGFLSVVLTGAMIVATPVLAILAGLTAALAGIFMIGATPILAGMALFATLLSAIIPIGVMLLFTFLLFRREGETVMETLGRGVKLVTAGFMGWFNTMKANYEFIKAAFAPGIKQLSLAFGEFVAIFAGGMNATEADMTSMGSTAAEVFTLGLKFIGFLFHGFALFARLGVFIYSHVISPVIGALSSINLGFRMLFDSTVSWKDALIQLFGGFAALLTSPFRIVGMNILSIMRTLLDTELGRGALKMMGLSPESMLKTLDVAIEQIRRPRTDRAHLFENQSEMAELQAKALASAQRNKAAATAPDVNATVTNKQEINLTSLLNVDGKELGRATKKHEQEVAERAGFQQTPWQRRQILENGMIQVPTF